MLLGGLVHSKYGFVQILSLSLLRLLRKKKILLELTKRFRLGGEGVLRAVIPSLSLK